MRATFTLAATLALAACASSSGGPKSVTAAPVASSGQPALGPAPAAAPDEVSPVEPPRALLFTMRVKDLGALVDALSKAARVPAVDPHELLAPYVDKSLHEALDLSQPIDVAFGVIGRGLSVRVILAVSVAVKDPEAARAAMTTVDEEKEREDDANVCELGPAAGAAPLRLVCGYGRRSVDAFSPYLRRNAARASYPSDVHAEGHLANAKSSFSAYRTFMGRGVGAMLGGAMYAPALEPTMNAVGTSVVDLAFDAESVVLDAQVMPDRIDVSMQVGFGDDRSTLTHLLAAHPERADAPPPAFWDLPGDARAAFFHRGVDDADVARLRDGAAEALRAQLARDGVPENDRSAIVDAASKMATGAPAVYASGVDTAAAAARASKALAARRTPPASAAERDFVEAMLGWRVIGVEEPLTTFASATKDLVSAWHKPGVARAYARGHDPQVRALPVLPAAKLPHDTVHLAFDVDPIGDGHGPAAYVRMHALFAPDGDRTWIGIGCDESLVSAKLASIVSSGAVEDGLSARTDLGWLRAARAGAGGFVTSLALVSAPLALKALFGGDVTAALDVYDGLPPERGAAAVPFTSTPRTDRGAVISVHLDRAALDDARGALLHFLH